MPLVDGVFAVFNVPIVGGPADCLAMEVGPVDCPAVGGGSSLGCVAVGVGPANCTVVDCTIDGLVELPPDGRTDCAVELPPDGPLDGPTVGLVDGPA